MSQWSCETSQEIHAGNKTDDKQNVISGFVRVKYVQNLKIVLSCVGIMIKYDNGLWCADEFITDVIIH